MKTIHQHPECKIYSDTYIPDGGTHPIHAIFVDVSNLPLKQIAALSRVNPGANASLDTWPALVDRIASGFFDIVGRDKCWWASQSSKPFTIELGMVDTVFFDQGKEILRIEIEKHGVRVNMYD